MTDKRLIELSRRKILAGLGAVGAAGAAAGLGTTALFSDEEAFENNTITAGTTNLKVTLGVVDADADDGSGGNPTVTFDPDPKTADGSVKTGIDINDMKPGDAVIVRVTVEIEDNPMYVSVEATDATDSENRPNPEPEPSPGPDSGTDGLQGEGDLDNKLDATLGWDSDRSNLHDNSLEGSIEPESGFDGTKSATDLIEALQTGFVYRGRNGEGGSPPGGHGESGADLTRIGGDASDSNVDREQVTHFIKFELPTSVGNVVQGDSLSWDLVWEAEQVRNNPDPLSGDDATLLMTTNSANPP